MLNDAQEPARLSLIPGDKNDGYSFDGVEHHDEPV